jgi:bifunctional non-homologous end joining protein LigD
MADTLASTSLHYRADGSDKVYNVAIVVSANGGFDVVAAWGRRGATLQQKTKETGVVEVKARQVYERLVNERIAKGYKVIDGDAVAFAKASERDGRAAGLPIQLLNPVSLVEFEELLDRNGVAIQEKIDGQRRLLIVRGSDVAGVNRRGLFVPLPPAVEVAAAAIGNDSILDGELIGDTLYVFDAQQIRGTDVTQEAFAERFALLEAIVPAAQDAIRLVPCIRGAARRQYVTELRERGAEGVVLRYDAAPYTPGRPNSGGTAFKRKFYETLSVVTLRQNEQHSVAMGVYDGAGRLQDVGNVTIPPSQTLPQVGAVLEVRYLYAFPGGCLYQPTFLSLRDDIDAADCTIDQLVYKAASTAA